MALLNHATANFSDGDLIFSQTSILTNFHAIMMDTGTITVNSVNVLLDLTIAGGYYQTGGTLTCPQVAEIHADAELDGGKVTLGTQNGFGFLTFWGTITLRSCFKT
jgi:hypothetical protein